MSIIKTKEFKFNSYDNCAKLALQESYKNCLSFPWIKEKVIKKKLIIHLWFFDVKTGEIFTFNQEKQEYQPLT